MYVVLKTVNGWSCLVVGPFALESEALSYARAVEDRICPVGEKWDVWKLEAPKL